jgi:hypothetical protein
MLAGGAPGSPRSPSASPRRGFGCFSCFALPRRTAARPSPAPRGAAPPVATAAPPPPGGGGAGGNDDTAVPPLQATPQPTPLATPLAAAGGAAAPAPAAPAPAAAAATRRVKLPEWLAERLGLESSDDLADLAARGGGLFEEANAALRGLMVTGHKERGPP